MLNTLPKPVPKESIVLLRYKTVFISGFLAIGPFEPSAKSFGVLSCLCSTYVKNMLNFANFGTKKGLNSLL